MFENKHDEAISYAQSTRSKNGGDWEDRLFQYGNPYGLIECKHIKVFCLETGKQWEMDGLLNDKIFVEMCTSVKDGKEAKIIGESKAFKRQYPNHKFVVFIKHIDKPRKSDGLNSYYDHLIKCSTIDNVLLGWDEVTRFIKNPFWNKKLKISKLKSKPINRLKKENQMNIQDKMIQALMNQGPQFVGQVLNSMNHTTITKTRKPTTKKKDKNKITKVKSKYFNKNVRMVQENHHDFVSLEELGIQNKSKFYQKSLATKIMKGGGQLLMKDNESVSSLMYGISREWV